LTSATAALGNKPAMIGASASVRTLSGPIIKTRMWLASCCLE
jgi:hypothetical protein